MDTNTTKEVKWFWIRSTRTQPDGSKVTYNFWVPQNEFDEFKRDNPDFELPVIGERKF